MQGHNQNPFNWLRLNTVPEVVAAVQRLDVDFGFDTFRVCTVSEIGLCGFVLCGTVAHFDFGPLVAFFCPIPGKHIVNIQRAQCCISSFACGGRTRKRTTMSKTTMFLLGLERCTPEYPFPGLFFSPPGEKVAG